MGLIYVNPEGPNGNHDPLAAAKDIRDSFGRMAMDDEEIVALIAGGHSFGKAHGAHKPEKCVGADPAGAPAGATQWIPKGGAAADQVPDAHDPKKRHAPIMFTTDMALKEDPGFAKISKRFLENPKEFEAAFARAWFKLTHRDMGPRARYLGKDIPKEVFKWQDPIPAVNHKLVSSAEVAHLKNLIAKAGISNADLIRTAWASASFYRGTDMRGGANGARILLSPVKDWKVNSPEELSKVVSKLQDIQKGFNKGGRKISMADLIVLGGAVGIENAAKAGGYKVSVPFAPGRMDATQEQTDVESFRVLEPKADAFRNYYGEGSYLSPAEALVDRANMLTLTVPEMTVLWGGLRVLDVNWGHSKNGVFTQKPGVLSTDFFVNLLDMSTQWQKSSETGLYEGRDRKTGALKWTATPVDLIFGSHSELRSVVEVYASADSKQKFANDFVQAWNKVMQLDRFDLK